MKRIVEKPERVAICRRCHGTGIEHTPALEDGTICPQCGGSGRVLVKCRMELDLKPYKRDR